MTKILNNQDNYRFYKQILNNTGKGKTQSGFCSGRGKHFGYLREAIELLQQLIELLVMSGSFTSTWKIPTKTITMGRESINL